MIEVIDLPRYHHACKLIEVDGVHGYRTCRERYGTEIANALLVAFFRRCHSSEEQYPPPDSLETDVANALKDAGLLKPSALHPLHLQKSPGITACGSVSSATYEYQMTSDVSMVECQRCHAYIRNTQLGLHKLSKQGALRADELAKKLGTNQHDAVELSLKLAHHLECLGPGDTDWRTISRRIQTDDTGKTDSHSDAANNM